MPNKCLLRHLSSHLLVLQGRQRMAAMTEEEQARYREERNARGLARKQERQEAKALMEKVGGRPFTIRPTRQLYCTGGRRAAARGCWASSGACMA